MAGTVSYNFDPQQQVYVITSCQKEPSRTNLITRDDDAIQVSPVSGDELLVRSGVVQEINISVKESTTNRDGAATVDVLGGDIVAVDILTPGLGYYPDARAPVLTIQTAGGAITSVTIVDPGAGYTDGTGYQVVLTDPTLQPGPGTAVATLVYDVVGGEIVSATVNTPGSGYVDGTIPVGNKTNAGPTPNRIPFPDEAVVVNLTTTAGGGNGNGEIVFEVINGELANPVIAEEGNNTYTDGTSIVIDEIPAADALDYTIVYTLRLDGDRQRKRIEVPVGFDGVEQQGDIFADIASAVTEYENRVNL